MRHGDYDVAGNDDVGDGANRSRLGRAVLWSGHHAQVEDVENDDDGEMHLLVRGVAVEAVVDYGNVGARDEDGDAAVI